MYTYHSTCITSVQPLMTSSCTTILAAFSDSLPLRASLSRVRDASLRVPEQGSTLFALTWGSTSSDAPMISTLTDLISGSRQQRFCFLAKVGSWLPKASFETDPWLMAFKLSHTENEIIFRVQWMSKQRRDGQLAERSEAPVWGTGPKGRGFECLKSVPHTWSLSISHLSSTQL